MDSKQETPMGVFNSLYDDIKSRLEKLTLTDEEWKSLIATRVNIQHAFEQLKYIHPNEKLDMYEKISELHKWLIKVG